MSEKIPEKYNHRNTMRKGENISLEALEVVNDILAIIAEISSVLDVLSVKSDFRINMLKMLAENTAMGKVSPDEALKQLGEILLLSKTVN